MGTISACFGGLSLRRRRSCRSQGRRPVGRLARWTEQLAGATDQGDWSALPEDLLIMAMGSMEVLDVVNSGAVCSSWRTAYAQFRRLRLPAKPNPPPCLLHARAADGGAAIYCPSTGATFPCRIGGGRGFVVSGSAHGWVFAADKATADPFLLNPLTGARAALPRLATLERVMGTFVDTDGAVVYNVDYWRPTSIVASALGVEPVTAQRALDWMLCRVAISAAGVVLLVHMPHGEASYARPGDERWTPLSGVLPSISHHPIGSVVHNNDNDLFYLMCECGTVFSMDLAGPVPAARRVSYMTRELGATYMHTYYLVFRGGELLLVTRRLVLTRPRADDKDDVVSTTDIWIKKVASPGPGRLPGIGDDYAMFLGHNEPMCLPVKDYPMLRGNCAYLADDSELHFPPITRRDVGIWDFGTGSMHNFHGDQLRPWLDQQPPIWITPSLY